MKFGKRLRCLLEDSLPEWRDKFISYKRLKQSLNMIIPADDCNPLYFSHHSGNDGYCDRLYGARWTCVNFSSCRPEQLGLLFCRRLAHAEENFIALLFGEVEKMNAFFMEKEEEFVIRLQDTKGKLEKLQQLWGTNLELSQDIIEIRKAIVNIHGEMVLLENYSALNYTGLAKIIKKHDKKTGSVLRMHFIQSVLQEPFFATDIISKLVQECEETLQFLFPHSNLSRSRSSNCNNEKAINQDRHSPFAEYSEVIVDDDNVMRLCRNTKAAWHILRELRKGSSTYNLFSVPPFGFVDFDDGPYFNSSMAEEACWSPEIPVGLNV